MIKNNEIQLSDKLYNWPCIIATVSKPLLGADFLRHLGLLVDVRNQRLIDATTYFTVPLQVAHHQKTQQLEAIASSSDCFAQLLAEFPEVTRPTFSALQTHCSQGRVRQNGENGHCTTVQQCLVQPSTCGRQS